MFNYLKKRRKINILTFWGVPNYGAWCQAYALQKIISTLYPNFVVKQIAYLHPKHKALYFPKLPKFEFNTFIHRSIFKLWFKYLKQGNTDTSPFGKAWLSIPNIKCKNKKKLEDKKWDIFITGSDCIWEYSIEDFGNDEHLIGNNINCNNLISYATSFGDMNLGDELPDFVSYGLYNYNNISVRDKSSYDIVKSILGNKISVPIVLDPVLLHDFKYDSNFHSSKYSNYILVYGDEFSDSLIKELIDFAHLNKLTIIGAGIVPDWCDIKLKNIDPREWIGLFKNANYTVTCTFHGLMFSILFEKHFLFYQVEYVKNRSQTLLENLKLSNFCYHEGVNNVDKILLSSLWNYKDINKELKILKEKSLDFIKDSIKND